MSDCIQSFVGQAQAVREAVHDATDKANAWAASQEKQGRKVTSIAVQTFTTEGAQWFHVITVAVVPR